MVSKEELNCLGKEGMIPGPNETEVQFLRRVELLKKISQNPYETFKERVFEKWDPDFYEQLGAVPKWLPLTYSNQGLSLWQGGAMWVFETPSRDPIPMIQLRKQFKKGRFLFYSKDEVLLHEALHAIRIGFNEPRFEEVLAYYHSRSRWRRFFGPLFRKTSHALFFLSLILLSLAAQTTALFFLTSPLLPYLKVFALVPLIDLAFRISALIKDQRLLKKTLKKLSEIFPNQKDSFSIAVRLNDAEIQTFATDSIEKILDYIEEKIPNSIRWRQILAQFC